MLVDRVPRGGRSRSSTMRLFGPSKTEKIAFFNSKITPWTDNAVAIGTTSGAMTALAALLATAQEKMADQVAAQAAAKTATATCDDAVRALVVAGMDVVKSIRTKAATGGQAVYDLAQIPAPANPTPVNTLGKASDFLVTLSESGELELSWKCSNPRASGVLYQIWRRIGATGEFSYLGGTGTKEFTD